MTNDYTVNVPADVRFLDKVFRAGIAAGGKLPKGVADTFKLIHTGDGWRVETATVGLHGEIAAMRWASRINTLRTLVLDPVDKRATTLTFEGLRYTVAAAKDMLARMEAGMSC